MAEAADGLGFSLVYNNPNPTGDPNESEYWRASSSINGSPGTNDMTLNILPIFINEILTHSDYPQVDYIELYNPNNAEVNISNWFLTDKLSNPKRWSIPNDTKISGNEYLVLYEGHFSDTVLNYSVNEFGSIFSLSSHGEDIYLYSADEKGNLTGYVHGFSFGEVENGVSLGRYITSENAEHFVRQIKITPKSENSDPKVGPLVITKINYEPNEDHVEFLELKNISSFNLALYNSNEIENTWKINGISFEFPHNIILQPQEIIYITENHISSDNFRIKYNLSNDIKVFHYDGKLDNNGEKLKIQIPDESFNNDGETVVPYITIDEVHYNDQTPWSFGADNTGSSIFRIYESEYGNDPINWDLETITEIENDDNEIPSEYSLSQNYPNPFNPNTVIEYTIPAVGSLYATNLQINVYDVLGNKVATLVNENHKAGKYKFIFDTSQYNLASGIYFYQIKSGEFVETRKMILLK